MEKGEVCAGTKLYFDNLFTTMKLLDWLSAKGIGGTGTMRQNRIAAIPVPSKKEVERNYERGAAFSVFSGDKGVVVWMDNKPVYCGSNIDTTEDTFPVAR